MDWSEYKGSFHRSPGFFLSAALFSLILCPVNFGYIVLHRLLMLSPHRTESTGLSWAPSLLCGLEHTSTQSSDSTKGSLNVILSLRHHYPLLPHVQCHAACHFIYFVCFSLVPEGCVNIMFIPSRPEVEVTSFLFNQRFLITSFVVLFLTFIYSEFTEQLLWITIMPRIST